MSKHNNFIDFGIGVSIILTTISIIWLVFTAGRGIVRSFHQTPEQKAQYQAQQQEDKAKQDAQKAKEAADWAKDPTNPKFVAQTCIDRGGIPTFSAWDGSVTSCKGADQKNVNIEVNQ